MTKLYEVQRAVYERLARKIKVFDHIPSDTNFPYVVLGRVQSVPVKTKTTDGERIEQTIDIWSAAQGKKETIDMAKLIEEALGEELQIDDVCVVSQEIKSIEVLEEENNLYHGTITFETLIDIDKE